MKEGRLKIAWFSPLNGASVSAYVTRILLPLLSSSHDITVFSQEADSWNGYQSHNYLNAVKYNKQKRFDIFFYNLEDSVELNFSRIHLALKPGVVWFHDFFMTSYGPEPILNSSWSETVKHYKEINRLWPERDAEFKPTSVVAEREAALSILPLFSNPRDFAEYKRLIKSRLINDDISPSLLQHPVSESLFNLAPKMDHQFTIGLSIKPSVEDHAHILFAALKRISFTGKLLWPVVASDRSAALDLLNEFQLIDNCQLLENDGPSGWEQIVKQINLAVHLRFSAFKQPSPYLPISLAAGVPSLVTDFAAGAVYPDSSVFKIKPGRFEESEIAAIIRALIQTQGARYAEISRNYALEFHHPRSIASALIELLKREANKITSYLKAWDQLEELAHQEVIRESLVPSTSMLLEQDLKTIYIDSINKHYKELGWI